MLQRNALLVADHFWRGDPSRTLTGRNAMLELPARRAQRHAGWSVASYEQELVKDDA